MKAKEEKMPHRVRRFKLTSTGKLIDDALEAVEKGNPRNGDLRIASSSSPKMATGTSPPPEGTPQLVSEASDKNANFAWVQHMLHHLAPNGSMALLLANGTMSSNASGEGYIRRALIEADLVECITTIPKCRDMRPDFDKLYFLSLSN